jgi:hypothetical protein
MRCTMKILATVVLSVAVVGAVYAKPGSGKGPGGSKGPSSGNGGQVFSRQSNPVNTQTPKMGQSQFKSQKLDQVVRSDRVQINHVDKSFKLSINSCPSKSYKKCDFGYCFSGKSCCHWEYKCWQPLYGCYFFYCPYTYCDYWFCVEDDCYYPVGFCPVAYRVKYKFVW